MRVQPLSNGYFAAMVDFTNVGVYATREAAEERLKELNPSEFEVKGKYETVNHPQHYGGADNPYEAIKVIEAWKLGFCLGNTVKYICRAGAKPDTSDLQDLKKAQWYLSREIERREKSK